MDAEQFLAPEDTSPLGRSRADVLDMLRAADGPLSVREIAQRTGLHPNTARFHLEALTEAGLTGCHRKAERHHGGAGLCAASRTRRSRWPCSRTAREG
jgi:predicted ArsR family transcriptional regulator